jgi:hypothetical protein
MPEILDPCQVQGLHSGLCSRNVLGMSVDLVNCDRNGASIPPGAHQRRQLGRSCMPFRSRLGPDYLREEIASVFDVNGASTALARNALREADALVFLVLRYRAAHRPACREARARGP